MSFFLLLRWISIWWIICRSATSMFRFVSFVYRRKTCFFGNYLDNYGSYVIIPNFCFTMISLWRLKFSIVLIFIFPTWSFSILTSLQSWSCKAAVFREEPQDFEWSWRAESNIFWAKQKIIFIINTFFT